MQRGTFFESDQVSVIVEWVHCKGAGTVSDRLGDQSLGLWVKEGVPYLGYSQCACRQIRNPSGLSVCKTNKNLLFSSFERQ